MNYSRLPAFFSAICCRKASETAEKVHIAWHSWNKMLNFVDTIELHRLSQPASCVMARREPDNTPGGIQLMIRPTEIQADLASVQADAAKVRALLDERGQLSVTARPGASEPLLDALGWLPEDAKEADYSRINNEFRGGAIEALLNRLPFRHGRVRLMRLAPKSCLSIHADSTRRYHYAVITSPDCYLVELNGTEGKFHHIPADGRLYEMDARLTHTAINAGREARIHIVICNADESHALDARSVGRIQSLDAKESAV